MAIDLYINNYNVDIVDDDRIAISSQVFDMLQIGSLVSSFTKSIKLPLTAKNMKVFENAHLLNSGTDLVHEHIDCKLIIDGIEIISYGYAYINEITAGYIDLNLFFSTFMLFEELKDKTLNELSLSDLDHYWNSDNILKLTSPALTDDIQYPIVEWGGQILDESPVNSGLLNTLINLEALLPMVKCERILNQIMEDANYSIGNTLDFSTYFQKLYLGMGSLKADETTNEDVEETYADVQLSDNNLYHTAIIYLPEIGEEGEGDIWFAALWFDNIVGNQCFQLETVPAVTQRTAEWTRFRVNTTGSMQFHARINWETPNPEEYFAGKIEIVLITSSDFNFYDTDENGKGPTFTKIAESELFEYTPSVGWLDGRDYGEVTTPYEPYAPGDKICVILKQYGNDSSMPYMSQDSYFEVVNESAQLTGIGYGYKWNIALNLPSMTQIDFIKGILQLYNLVITKDVTRNIVYIRRFDDVFKNIYQHKDWTNKILNLDSATISFVPEGFGKKNWFRYQSIGENQQKIAKLNLYDVPDSYDYYFEIENAMLPGDTDIVLSPFYVAPHVIRNAQRLFVPHVDFMNLGYQLTSGTAPVVLYIDTNQSLGTKALRYYSWMEDVDYSILLTYVKAWFDDYDGSEGMDLSWQKILTEHYGVYINAMQNFKMLSVAVKMTAEELQNFDFSIPVYLEQYSSYFYVNSIKDYINGFATVELIKLY